MILNDAPHLVETARADCHLYKIETPSESPYGNPKGFHQHASIST